VAQDRDQWRAFGFSGRAQLHEVSCLFNDSSSIENTEHRNVGLTNEGLTGYNLVGRGGRLIMDPGRTEKIMKSEPGYPMALSRLNPSTYRMPF
jgi:hypothetical protein